MGRYDDIDPMDIDPETGRPYNNYSSPSLDTSFHDGEMDDDGGYDGNPYRRSHLPKMKPVKGKCGHTITLPEWNPYEGIWECECGESIDNLIPCGPADANFDFYNQNPNI